MRMLLLTSAFIVSVVGCTGEKLDVGSNSVNTASGGSSGTLYSGPAVLPTWPGPSDCAIGTQLGIVGKWEGYAEGGNNLHIVINGASEEHGVCGTVTYGEGTPPPPPTDPNVAYPPPDYGYGYGTACGGGPAVGFAGPFLGYPYTTLDGTVEASRVRFRTSTSELWRQWCALQTPTGTDECVPYSSGGCNCSGGPCSCWLVNEHGQHVSVDCGKFQLCRAGVCVCNDAACAASTDLGGGSFDLNFQGDSADGSLSISARYPGTLYSGRVRLFRAQP